jgi:hypothetical protein
MEMPYVFSVHRAYFKRINHLITKAMLELFIELTNQIFWEGYAQQLATENPAVFQLEFNEFLNTYQL